MIVILGGGLAGLSTAYHLRRSVPDASVVVLEKDAQPGGLCRSRRRDGFTFDYTGHYLHLRDADTIEFVEELLGDDLVRVDRVAKIHAHGQRLAFPYQANLHGLPREVVARSIVDFANACAEKVPTHDRMRFGQWARAIFGDAIAEAFMIPYNTKLFRCDADEITAEWVAWAVPRPSLEQVVRGALGIPNERMGYNPSFLYPRDGGIGLLPAKLAERVGDDLRCEAEIVEIDAQARRVTLASGETYGYEQLVSTLPLPRLLEITRGLPELEGDERSASDLAGALRWTRVADVGLGVARPEIADGAHWIYFPELEYPFYRVGFPSNACSAMAPEGCSSMSVEFAFGRDEAIPGHDELERAARAGLERAGLIEPGERFVHRDVAVLDPAYVVFDEACTPTTKDALRRLESVGIHSIGRFGAWTYSYMERAIIDGREAAARIGADVTA
jgi:protoporphyrinogen oxidase